MKIKQILNELKWYDYLLLAISITPIIVMFSLYPGNYWSLASSLTAVISVLFISKGLVIGQVFSLMYAIAYGVTGFISGYYGETIVEITMMFPLNVASIIVWYRNRYKGGAVVKVGHMSPKSWLILATSTITILVSFFFILRAINTQNLIVSTLSIATSFAATYLCVKRSPYYAAAYMLNDIVLIILWSIELNNSHEYITLLISSIVLFINDLYGLYNWLRMRNSQNNKEKAEQ